MPTLEAMSSHHNFRPGQQNKLVSEPPIAAPDEHAHLIEADQRFRAALGQAIAAGGERIRSVQCLHQFHCDETHVPSPFCARSMSTSGWSLTVARGSSAIAGVAAAAASCLNPGVCAGLRAG